MEGQHIKGLMEAYSTIYSEPELIDEQLYIVEDFLGEEVEILDEELNFLREFDTEEGSNIPSAAERQRREKEKERARIERDRLIQQAGGGAAGEAQRRKGKEAQYNAQFGLKNRGWTNSYERSMRSDAALDRDARYRTRQTGEANLRKLGGGDLNKGLEVFRKQQAEKDAKNKKPNPTPPAGGGGGGGGGGSRPAAPASQTVLAKKGGVEGKLDKATGKFTAGNFSDAEKARYNKVAGQKKDAATNAKYQELRKTDPAKAKEFGMKANQAKYGKDFAKPKTPNPLMKDMPGRNKAELERVRGNAAIASISKSPNAKKILSTSKIGQASVNRSQFGSATKPAAPAPKPAAPAPKPAAAAPKPAAPAPKPAAAAPTPKPAPKPTGAQPRKEPLWNSVDLFDLVKGYLLDEGYAETEENALVIMTNMSEEWRDDIVERYKGKHGQSSDEYKDDRSQGGKMVSGDSKMSGAEYTHGRRVKAANPGSQPDEGGKTKPKSQGKMDKGTRADLEYRKANLKKEEASVTLDAILSLLDENREHDREMRKAAARERAEEKRGRKEDGKKSAKSPGRLGKSAGSSYADYQEVSIKAHDKATKGKYIPGMVKNEEVELDENRRAARAAGGSKDDSKKQPDPSKDGFTGIGNMSIKDIMALNKKIQAKEEVELDENRRAARSAGGYKDDSKKQPDPSKDGFTGIGNMSIKDIMALNKKIQAKKDKKD